ncbi:MAG TPA: class II aldolase/adducin family protein [bacterium]|nr:class II aldolase/adducin family protein [bacterium]HEX67732.1 class II aldolase/adducin family protein [bacterium]
MQLGESELRELIVEVGKRLWVRRFVAANDGNISVRLNEKEILCTPRNVSKGFMTPDIIIKVDITGKVLSSLPSYEPSSELKLHLAVYKEREDVNAVLHAHPPYSTSFAVAGIPLDKYVLPETIIMLGSVPIAPYGTPSTDELVASIKPFIKEYNAVLLANHGAVTWGEDLMDAYFKMETLEHSAEIIFHSHQLGRMNVLPQEQVKKLFKLKEKYKRGPKR